VGLRGPHRNFDEQIMRLDETDLLYLVVGKFADVDLRPGGVSNLQMSYSLEKPISGHRIVVGEKVVACTIARSKRTCVRNDAACRNVAKSFRGRAMVGAPASSQSRRPPTTSRPNAGTSTAAIAR
jgi:hypothetical protein